MFSRTPLIKADNMITDCRQYESRGSCFLPQSAVSVSLLARLTRLTVTTCSCFAAAVVIVLVLAGGTPPAPLLLYLNHLNCFKQLITQRQRITTHEVDASPKPGFVSSYYVISVSLQLSDLRRLSLRVRVLRPCMYVFVHVLPGTLCRLWLRDSGDLLAFGVVAGVFQA